MRTALFWLCTVGCSFSASAAIGDADVVADGTIVVRDGGDLIDAGGPTPSTSSPSMVSQASSPSS